MGKIVNRVNEGIFIPEEERILSKTMEIREKIVDEMIKHGIPTKTSEIRVLNEVLSAMDKQILDKADRRLKHDENKNDEALAEMALQIMRNLNSNQGHITRKDPPVIDMELDDEKIVPDEISLEYKEIDVKEILKD